MQGQRSAIGSVPETLGYDHGSTSSDASIDQEICWNNMRNSAHNMLPDCTTPPRDPSGAYLDSMNQGQNFGGWNLGEPSSSGTQNHVSHNERKAEHGWSTPMVACGGAGPVLEEQQYEPANILSMNNVSVNCSSNQIANSPLFVQSSSNAIPQDLNMSAGFVGPGSDDCHIMDCPNAHKSDGSENLRMPSASSSSDPFGVPFGSGGYLVEENDGRPSCSLDGRRLSCKSQFTLDGTVLELTDSNFDAAISSFDYVFVDFYAPWCSHCKHLAPELDKAASILAGLKEPLVIAKVNADKFTRLAKKYEINGFPTLKIFMHGVPTDYYGPRKADLLVQYLKKFVALDVAILNSDSAISDFIEAAGTDFPIYVGFGLNESVISNWAIKYKKKAWFSVAKDFSEDVMVLYDFDKVPALASLRPNYNEQSIFYGPFKDPFLEDFVRQNLLPLVMPINYDTLKLLKDDKRKIVLTIMEDMADKKSNRLIKLLKAAASANRDLVFGYVGVKQWEDFADNFEIMKPTKLPKMVVWDGNEEYFSVVGLESIDEHDQGSQITQFLEGYREGSVIQKQIRGPSFMGYIHSLIGIKSVYIIVFVVAVIMLFQYIFKEEPLRVGTRDPADHASGSSSASQGESKELPLSGEKED